MTRFDLADTLERFVGDAPHCGDYEWDDFTSVKQSPELEPYRQRLLLQGDGLFDIDEIRQIIIELRT
ncbi:hypothetical protein [Sphingomonas baiyangensis]|uniref:Uncharacterized protein n=1 Tax=Sphingomonas baiyangensis TaxID=2572576 RepID=A0A4U1L6Q1_9SPHN|nr:hypothetical protein [Sphingomonas baiyangensis]TKD52023.1 hypothetical protein FBR43_15715 [Sphingomonas baiyangensis]